MKTSFLLYNVHAICLGTAPKTCCFFKRYRISLTACHAFHGKHAFYNNRKFNFYDILNDQPSFSLFWLDMQTGSYKLMSRPEHVILWFEKYHFCSAWMWTQLKKILNEIKKRFILKYLYTCSAAYINTMHETGEGCTHEMQSLSLRNYFSIHGHTVELAFKTCLSRNNFHLTWGKSRVIWGMHRVLMYSNIDPHCLM
jgi:hypothetical protein